MLRFISLLIVTHFLFHCAGDNITGHLGEGSIPANHKEEVEYNKALNRCYKTGGTRIVKISGMLRCF